MPVVIDGEIRPVEQAEFGRIAYEVMECVFELHRQIGRFFDEDVYQSELVHRLPGARPEVAIDVRFGDFRKRYSIDLVVAPGALFELKSVEKLHDRHQAQLLNYLLLCGVLHGKLINLRPERVQHKFINTSLTYADRSRFAVDTREWRPADPALDSFRQWMVEALRDWGTCLDHCLYTEAATYYFGGEERVAQSVGVVIGARLAGKQRVHLAGPDAAFQVTTLDSSGHKAYEWQLRRFLDHTTLNEIHWINVSKDIVHFKTITRRP
jgi:GxxExxY protein